MRSAWMAQEILSTFEGDVDELALLPGSGGIFEIYANGQLIWSRKAMGRFPEITEAFSLDVSSLWSFLREN